MENCAFILGLPAALLMLLVSFFVPMGDSETGDLVPPTVAVASSFDLETRVLEADRNWIPLQIDVPASWVVASESFGSETQYFIAPDDEMLTLAQEVDLAELGDRELLVVGILQLPAGELDNPPDPIIALQLFGANLSNSQEPGFNVTVGPVQPLELRGAPAALASLSSDTADGYIALFLRDDRAGLIIALSTNISRDARLLRTMLDSMIVDPNGTRGSSDTEVVTLAPPIDAFDNPTPNAPQRTATAFIQQVTDDAMARPTQRPTISLLQFTATAIIQEATDMAATQASGN